MPSIHKWEDMNLDSRRPWARSGILDIKEKARFQCLWADKSNTPFSAELHPAVSTPLLFPPLIAHLLVFYHHYKDIL